MKRPSVISKGKFWPNRSEDDDSTVFHTTVYWMMKQLYIYFYEIHRIDQVFSTICIILLSV